jgi:hypothetical protein
VALDNPEFGKIAIKTAIGPTGSSLMNITFFLNQDVTVVKCLVVFSIPKDKNDRNYENIVIKTTVDVCKMLQGVTGNFITRMAMENIKDMVDFELKCPLKKVRKCMCQGAAR